MYIEKIQRLMEKAPGESQDIVDYASYLTKYVNTVAMQELRQDQNRALLVTDRITQEEYISRIERMNEERNNDHDKACAACKNINDIAKRNGLPKIFDFEPQLVQDKTGRMAYSQDNHHKVAGFCASFINEYYERGALKENQYLIDQVAEKAKETPYKPMNKEAMDRAAKDRKTVDLTDIAEEFMKRKKKGKIELRDGVTIEISTYNKYNEMDVVIKGTNNMGSHIPYFDKTDKGFEGIEIPQNVIKEIMDAHGGAVDIKPQKEENLFEQVMEGNFDHNPEQGNIIEQEH